MHMNHSEQVALSVGISIIMILLYAAALYFRLVTHRGVYQHKSEEVEEHEEPEWGKGKATAILALATVAVAYLSERLVHTFETVAESFGWSELFIGIIIVAIVGNAAEHASAVIMAYKNKMNVAVEIAVGSNIANRHVRCAGACARFAFVSGKNCRLSFHFLSWWRWLLPSF